MENFNKLTPAQTERLAILMEECAEVQHVIGKILRFGYDSYKPSDPEMKNTDYLELELGDILYAINLMSDNGDIDMENIQWRVLHKTEKTKKYLKHQK